MNISRSFGVLVLSVFFVAKKTIASFLETLREGKSKNWSFNGIIVYEVCSINTQT